MALAVDVLSMSLRFPDVAGPSLFNYYLFYTPEIVYQLIPIACLLGVLFTLSSLNRSNELLDLFASGMSLIRICYSIFAAVIALSVIFFTDHDTLQELIIITNFKMDSQLPFLLVLIGQPELREKLNRRMHEPLNQRITYKYHMAGLTSDEEVRDYILHHLKIVGRSDALFEESSFAILKQLGQGLPRKIGSLALSAMTIGMAQKSQMITGDMVIKAAAGI